MRIRIALDDEAANIVEQYAKAREMSLSRAISELILQSVRTKPRIKYVNGRPVFDLPPTKKRITTARVRKLEAETW
jgi:hypothetical protein